MELTSPSIIKELLTKYSAKPSKGLGQNFLIDKNILNKIIETACLKKDDIVLEIGPGVGTLTQELAKNVKKIIAIEKDRDMANILKETMAEYRNVEIIEGDILKMEASSARGEKNLENYLKIKNYKIVSNIPYYITSPVIRKFLEENNPPVEIILMVQKEVAQRICQKPPKMSLLSVSVQFYAKPEIISYVSKNCFLPAPKVDSAIIKITPFPKIVGDRDSHNFATEEFFKIVKAGFSHPRKQLLNNFCGELFCGELSLPREKIEEWLLKNNIKPTQRAETLAIEDWKNLAKSL
jgi:16S rRNA (adenine1518-N6/adenine1519-N6)-dimethyltransferase